MRLKRIAAGFYETRDGRYEVHGFQRPERDDYGPAGEWVWYWRPVNGDAHDRYYTKREALARLTRAPTRGPGGPRAHPGLGEDQEYTPTKPIPRPKAHPGEDPKPYPCRDRPRAHPDQGYMPVKRRTKSIPRRSSGEAFERLPGVQHPRKSERGGTPGRLTSGLPDVEPAL